MSSLTKAATVTPLDTVTGTEPPKNALAKGAVDIASAIYGVTEVIGAVGGAVNAVKSVGRAPAAATPAPTVPGTTPTPVPAAPSSPLAVMTQDKVLLVGAGAVALVALLIFLKKA